jgi:hypothetical protein
MKTSPYSGKDVSKWGKATETLIKKHPLSENEIVNAVLDSWDDIFKSKIGGLKIGKDIHPSPQIISFLLHELIAHRFSKLYPAVYKVGTEATEKDIHCLTNDFYSIEIKASSHASSIYGNRSYAQQNDGKGKKNKNGYYLTINFKKLAKGNIDRPEISIIRFGYLEHSDWRGQKAETGQQASLSADAYKYKLKVLYSRN